MPLIIVIYTTVVEYNLPWLPPATECIFYIYLPFSWYVYFYRNKVFIHKE